MKTTRQKKTRYKTRHKVFRGLGRLSRAEVEWLKKDSRIALEEANELEAQHSAPSKSVKHGHESKQQLIAEQQFVNHVGIATAVTLTVQAAIDGDKLCGIFLGEIIPFLARQKRKLITNEDFVGRLSELRSAQKPRIEGRTLRTEIEEIIREAQLQRRLYFVKHDRFLSRARKDIRALEYRAKLQEKEGFKLNSKRFDDLRERLTQLETAAKAKTLQTLPEFTLASADQWFEQVVWPELHRRKSELRDNPRIGELKKATKSGKFQLSDLKIQAHQTVRRIAALPRTYFFW